MLELKDFSLARNKENLFSHVNITFPSRGIYALIGKNGCGKSSLFASFTSKIPYLGEILWKGKKLDPFNDISLIDLNDLYDELSVGDNLSFALKNDVIDYYLSYFKIEYLKNKKIKELSLGEKEIVAFIQKMINPRDIFLLDEATSHMDETHEELVFSLLNQYAQDHLVIFITNYLPLGDKYGDKIYRCEEKEIKINDNEKTNNHQEEIKISHHGRKKIKYKFLQTSFSWIMNLIFIVFFVLITFIGNLALENNKTFVIRNILSENIGKTILYTYDRDDNYLEKNTNFGNEGKVYYYSFHDGEQYPYSVEFSYYFGFIDELNLNGKEKVKISSDEVVMDYATYYCFKHPLFGFNVDFISFETVNDIEYLKIVDQSYVIKIISDCDSSFINEGIHFFFQIANEEKITSILQPYFCSSKFIRYQLEDVKNLNYYSFQDDAKYQLLLGRSPQDDNEVVISLSLASKVLNYFSGFYQKNPSLVEDEYQSLLGEYVYTSDSRISKLKIVGINDCRNYNTSFFFSQDEYDYLTTTPQTFSLITLTKNNIAQVASYLKDNDYTPLLDDYNFDESKFNGYYLNFLYGILGVLILGEMINLFFNYLFKKKSYQILYHNHFSKIMILKYDLFHTTLFKLSMMGISSIIIYFIDKKYFFSYPYIEKYSLMIMLLVMIIFWIIEEIISKLCLYRKVK